MKKLFLLLSGGLSVFGLYAQRVPEKPVVVLGFDDAESSHYTVVAPLLQQYHFNATFFVCEFPRKLPADSVHFLSWTQIKELHDMGFEIGNHTGHHKNVTTLSREQVQAEVSFVEEKCKAYNIPKPVSFAYPGNRADSAAQVRLQEMGYRFARAGGSTYYCPSEQPRLCIPSYTMGSGEKLMARTWKALQELKAGQILVFTIHGVPDILHPDYTTTPEVLEEYFEYMKEHNFEVIAMRDLDKYISVN
ncbi:MAG: polysaccharide deacetylase family protein [Chitinophagaceae bacterium]